MRSKLFNYFPLLLLSVLFSCGKTTDNSKIISVTIEPQRYFAEKIAGGRFEINTVVPTGQSPETFDPTPKQMIDIGKSRAYLQIGYIGFELAWMETIRLQNPHLRLFNLADGIELIEELDDNGEEHHHHHGHDHDGHLHHHHHHHGIDPHTWSSVSGARMIAWNTLQAFIDLDPEGETFYWNNYRQLIKEIEETESIIKELLADIPSRTFIIYHPALTYFAKENNLVQLCIEMDGKEPSPALLKELINTAHKHQANTIFIQQEFDRKNAEIIAAETGCRLTIINPLSYDWKKEMIHIAQSLNNHE